MIPELGEMNYAIKLQRADTTITNGQQVTVWTDLYGTFAARRYVRGNERFADNQKVAMASNQYWVHYTNSITEQDRLIDCETEQIMDIKAIARYREHGLIRLDCEAMPTSPQSDARGRGQ